ncbi:hypothetical protein [Tsukamurella paurometabola]|uniref:Uncharacterized protein n=1 Tax=Tsukamurella paurometabola TaxID=2061 RepID=A0ABS5NDV5_TSUPA|nr:hypothetical protein [Tsukamurella paurometabola]MBS4102437.1 hypothetical protein [Tsukamurella paurometabola]
MQNWSPAVYAAQVGITETVDIHDYTHEHQALADAVAVAALKPLREAWLELYDYEDDAEIQAGINIALERMEKLLFSAAEIAARERDLRAMFTRDFWKGA